MKIAAAQYPITFHATAELWQQHTARWVAEAASNHADLLVFPEYGAMELVSLLPQATELSLQQQVTELSALLPLFLETFSDLAKRHQCCIIAPSFPVVEAQLPRNRAYVVSPKGVVGYQDKFFMTRFENEEWGIAAAPNWQLSLFETNWGKFGIQICYDVEFPLGSQWLASAGATLVVAPSCTETLRGATRVHVGARARALENQCITVVSQTVGNAPWSAAVDINFGYAAAYGPPDVGFPEEGIIATKQPQEAGWLFADLPLDKLPTVRQQGQVLNFQDTQRIRQSLGTETIQVVTYQV